MWPPASTGSPVLLWPIKELYICQTLVNMHGLHGKVSVYRACGRDGGTIGMFHFSKQSKQSEDFLNQRRKSLQWTTSLTETWRPAQAAGRANNLWDLLWRATPFNNRTKRQNQTHTHTPYIHSLTFTPAIKPSENHNFDESYKFLSLTFMTALFPYNT